MASRLTTYRNRLVSFLAREIVRKYEPGIIAVTGAIGKTSAQEAIYAILRELRDVRTSSPEFTNAAHGALLGIMGGWTRGSGFFFWLKAIASGSVTLLTAQPYPELLILEYNPEPGFLRRMLDIARPQIAVVTAPAYPINGSVKNITSIIEAVPSNGCCIINHDDPAIFKLKECTRAHTMSFGFNEGAAMRITHLEYRAETPAYATRGKHLGISFKLEYEGNCVPVRLDGAFGKAPAYAIAAAACVGIAFGMNLVRIAEATHYYRAPSSRMQFIPGKKGTYLFDDTASTTTASLSEALRTLAAIPASRAIAVIGTIRLTRPDDEEIYEYLIKQAAKICDMLFLIGAAPIIDKKNIMRFDSQERALSELQTIMDRGDVILVTGADIKPIINALSSHRLVA